MSAIVFERAELERLLPLPQPRGCDFCADGMPTWRYPARTVPLGVVVVGEMVFRPISYGVWQACQECSTLIERGDWPALARHTLRSLNLDLRQAGPGVRVKMLAGFHTAHEQFRRARSGPRQSA